MSGSTPNAGGRVRCARCGSENVPNNRFCGMCGGVLVAAETVVAKPRPQAAPLQETVARHESVQEPAAGLRSPEHVSVDDRSYDDRSHKARSYDDRSNEDRSNEDRFEEFRDDQPIISGPSFLGLDQPSRARSRSDSSSVPSGDSRDRYSSNLSYLLEDEEEPKRGWGKLFAVIVAFCLLGGFGYLRWKQGSFDWLLKAHNPAQVADSSSTSPANGHNSSAPAATPNSSSANGNSVTANQNAAAPSSTNPSSTNPSATDTNPSNLNPNNPNPSNPNSSNPSSNNQIPAPQPAPDPSAQNQSAQTTEPANQTSPNQAAGSSPPVSGATGAPPGGAPVANQATPTSLPAPDAAPPKPSANNPSASSDAEDAEDSTAAAPEPKPERSAPKSRERKPTPAVAADPAGEAERYIYGHGTAQDCDRGLQLLKPAAEHAHIDSMVMLGNLYSTGTCAPRDLPTAYRWYALALRQRPENQRLQDDLQDLWRKMTAPERQLAIKLSH